MAVLLPRTEMPPRPKRQAGPLRYPEMTSDEWNSLRLQARRRCSPAAELLLTMSRPSIRRPGGAGHGPCTSIFLAFGCWPSSSWAWWTGLRCGHHAGQRRHNLPPRHPPTLSPAIFAAHPRRFQPWLAGGEDGRSKRTPGFFHRQAGQQRRLSLFCQRGRATKYTSFNFKCLLHVNSRRQEVRISNTGVQNH